MFEAAICATFYATIHRRTLLIAASLSARVPTSRLPITGV